MPLCIDLFAGLGGWTDGFLTEGWDVVGFDNQRHQYGWRKCEQCDGTGNFYRHDEDGDFLPCDCYENHGMDRAGTVPNRYPAQLVIQDVLTLHGSQFRNADMIVASPPCQKYSRMAMPWSLAKREVRWQRWERDSPFGDRLAGLNALFSACFRIQREASEAAGHHIPMVVENVKGAQPWVGRAAWHFGSFYLWGDVPAIMPVPRGSPKFIMDDMKNGRRRREVSGVYENGAVVSAQKVPGVNWNDKSKPKTGFNVTAAQRFREDQGTKQHGSGPEWFDTGICKASSRSDSRKAASAMIAKIPPELSQYIARYYTPRASVNAASTCGRPISSAGRM